MSNIKNKEIKRIERESYFTQLIIVEGFQNSGKTTLINALIEQNRFRNIEFKNISFKFPQVAKYNPEDSSYLAGAQAAKDLQFFQLIDMGCIIPKTQLERDKGFGKRTVHIQDRSFISSLLYSLIDENRHYTEKQFADIADIIKRNFTPDECKIIFFKEVNPNVNRNHEDSFDSIEKDLDNQKRVAYLYRINKLIDKYGLRKYFKEFSVDFNKSVKENLENFKKLFPNSYSKITDKITYKDGSKKVI